MSCKREVAVGKTCYAAEFGAGQLFDMFMNELPLLFRIAARFASHLLESGFQLYL